MINDKEKYEKMKGNIRMTKSEISDAEKDELNEVKSKMNQN